MFSKRGPEHWLNAVSENQIWKDRVRKENTARQNYNGWQDLYDEYKTLYSYCRNRTTTCVSVQKAQHLRKTTENTARRLHPETTQREIGWRHSQASKLEKFGTNIRGLKTKRDIYKSFNWPQN